MRFLKTLTQISFSIVDTEASGANINVTGEMVNYYNQPASKSMFEFSINGGSSWNTCSLAPFQDESDLGQIKLNSKKRNVKLVWSAAQNLDATSSYQDVLLRERFAESGSNNLTAVKSASIAEIDFRPTDRIDVLRPYPSEPDFHIKFKTLINDYQVRTHFIVEADTTGSYNSANYQIHNSENDQTGWTVSGSAFPAAGVLTATSSLGTLDVLLITGSLTSGSEGSWHYRVSRSLFSA